MQSSSQKYPFLLPTNRLLSPADSRTFGTYPITCIVFLRYFAGISSSSRQMMSMGLLP